MKDKEQNIPKMVKTTSLRLSRQLKEAGFPQETYFVYYPYDEDQKLRGRYFRQSTYDSNYDPNLWPIEKAIAAPTAEEILDLMKGPVVVEYRSSLAEAAGKVW